jgi:uncharacterized repeat protein (TIGR01451 family)
MKRIFSRLLGSLPKRIVAGTIIAVAIMLPVAVSAANTVQIEAMGGVADITAGATTYTNSTTATANQIVKIVVVYDNEQPAGSGETANNLAVAINIPTTPGASQTINTTVSSANSNTVTNQYTVNIPANAYLQYVPGSAVWTHAVSPTSSTTTSQTISDAVVTNSQGLVLENAYPCQAASVTVEAQVMLPGVQVTKQVEEASQTNSWVSTLNANPGDTLRYMISYINTGNTVENQVVALDNLPAQLTIVPNTATLVDAANPNGIAVSEAQLTNGGVNIGNFTGGSTAALTFEATVATTSQMACGQSQIANTASVQPQGMSQYMATATVDVNNVCQTQQPTYTCSALTVTTIPANREVQADVTYTAQNGATFQSVTYNFGDGSTPLTTTNTSTTYSYANYGTYNISATVTFNVNGGSQVATSANCTKTVSFVAPTPTVVTASVPATPTAAQLPNTGAGNVIEIFAATTIVGTIAYRLFTSRRLARSKN